jgi:predicted ATPase
MITGLTFKNYKAFSEAEIQLKPLTLFIGPNSVGKSSIFHFLLLLKQTLNSDRFYKSPLKLNGEDVNLGEIENIFHNKNLANPLSFSLTINSTEFTKDISFLHKRLQQETLENLLSLERIASNFLHIEVSDFAKILRNRIRSNETTIDTDEFSRLLEQIRAHRKKILAHITKNPSAADELQKTYIPQRNPYSRTFALDEINSIDIASLKNSNNYLSNLRSIQSNTFKVEYELRYLEKEARLFIHKVEVVEPISSKKIISYTYEKVYGQRKVSLYSDYCNSTALDKIRTSVGKRILPNSLFISPERFRSTTFMFRPARISRESDSGVMTDVVLSILYGAMTFVLVNMQKNKINHVSPLRAYPKRYYFLDESNISNSLNTIDGDNLTEVLKENKSVREKVNKWLNTFHLNLSVDELKDVIHKIKIKQHGLNLDITDVGFGISQILPVIVQGFLSVPASITLIEQPEIHLHPLMQAELADLFIDIIGQAESSDSKTLLIETHSEYLLKRLRRRISEGKLNSDQIALYFIHPKKNNGDGAKIERIEISKKGAFKWPESFYISELDDTISFLKNQ